MRKAKQQHVNYSIRTAYIFLGLVFSLIFVSLLFKAVSVVRQSTFDGKHEFNVVVSPNFVIAFAPDKQAISILNINNGNNGLGKVLEVPIDGLIQRQAGDDKGQELRLDDESVNTSLMAILLHPNRYKTNLTIIDKIRLYLFAKTVAPRNIAVKTVSLPLDDAQIDRTSFQLFSETTITQEKLSIGVINAAGVSGLGNRLTRLITNIGGNVVAVNTAEKTSNASEIAYFGDPTYTLERLQKILGFPLRKMDKQAISDIIITIGKDSVSSSKF